MIVSVTTTIMMPSRDGGTKNVWFFMDCPEFDTLDDLQRALAEDGSLYGQKLEVRPTNSETVKVIVGRQEQVVGAMTIATITPAHCTFREG